MQYYSSDFEFDSVVEAGRAFDRKMLDSLRTSKKKVVVDVKTKTGAVEVEGNREKSPPTRDEFTDNDAWDVFHSRHGIHFFREKRYIPCAFRELTEENDRESSTLLAIGCGSGSAVVPTLRANEKLRAVCVDMSPKAIDLFKKRLDNEGHSGACVVVTNRSDTSSDLLKRLEVWADNLTGSTGLYLRSSLRLLAKELKEKAVSTYDWNVLRVLRKGQKETAPIVCAVCKFPTAGGSSVDVVAAYDVALSKDHCRLFLRAVTRLARERSCTDIAFRALPRVPAVREYLLREGGENDDDKASGFTEIGARLVRRTPCSTWILPFSSSSSSLPLIGPAGSAGSSTPSLSDSRVHDSVAAIEFAPLRVEDTGIVNETWKYNRGKETIPMVRSMIRSGLTMAAYEVVDKDDRRRPVSWALYYETGAWGMLYTVSSHRRRGLGLEVVKRFLRSLRDTHHISRIYNYVEEQNKASESLCTKVGLVRSHIFVDWMFLRLINPPPPPAAKSSSLSSRVTFAVWNVEADRDSSGVPSVVFREGPYDFVLLVFVLSAIHPRHHVRVLRHIREICVQSSKRGARGSFDRRSSADSLRKCALCFRDYGLYDMTMLRSRASQIVPAVDRSVTDHGMPPRLFRRSDGTLRYFFDLKTVENVFRAAGWRRVRGEKYCRVSNKNRKTGVELKRVFVNAVFEPLEDTLT